MRHLTLLPMLVLSVGLMGCDRSSATAAGTGTRDAAGAVAVAPTAASVPVAPAPAAIPAPQDVPQDMPLPPSGNNLGMIPQGQAPRPPQTLEAMQTRNEMLFSRLDANADGAITGNELAALASGPQGARGGGRLREMIARADADRNARITLDELRAVTAQRFARMDANGDGVVTDEERPDRR